MSHKVDMRNAGRTQALIHGYKINIKRRCTWKKVGKKTKTEYKHKDGSQWNTGLHRKTQRQEVSSQGLKCNIKKWHTMREVFKIKLENRKVRAMTYTTDGPTKMSLCLIYKTEYKPHQSGFRLDLSDSLVVAAVFALYLGWKEKQHFPKMLLLEDGSKMQQRFGGHAMNCGLSSVPCAADEIYVQLEIHIFTPLNRGC